MLLNLHRCSNLGSNIMIVSIICRSQEIIQFRRFPNYKLLHNLGMRDGGDRQFLGILELYKKFPS